MNKNIGRREVRVRVTPKSKKESVREDTKGVVHVAVAEDTKEGRATQRVRELIALHFHVSLKKVVVIRGATARNKTIVLYTETV